MIYRVTETFETEIAKFTRSPFAIAVDSCTNAIFLSLIYIGIKGLRITIPNHTYVSVPCSIIHAGGKVGFEPSSKILKGAYQLKPTPVWDSALRLTSNMYIPETFMCLSFSGAKKPIKLGK